MTKPPWPKFDPFSDENDLPQPVTAAASARAVAVVRAMHARAAATLARQAAPPKMMTPKQRLDHLWKRFTQAKRAADQLNPKNYSNTRDPANPDAWLPHFHAEQNMRRALRLWIAERRRQMTPSERAAADQRAAQREMYTSKKPFFGEP